VLPPYSLIKQPLTKAAVFVSAQNNLVTKMMWSSLLSKFTTKKYTLKISVM